MADAWCLAVGISVVGCGLALLQLLRKDREDWLIVLVLIGDLGFLLLRKPPGPVPVQAGNGPGDGRAVK